MIAGLSANLHDIKDSRKTTVINNELRKPNLDIATPQETRFTDSDTLKKTDYISVLQGKGSGEPREHGVGFTVRNSLLRMVDQGSGGFERLLTLRLNSTTGPVISVSVYAPTLSTKPNAKDMFYENLASTIRDIHSKEQVVLLGDSNGRVGADRDTWPSCLCQFGVGNIHENRRLPELCTFHDLYTLLTSSTSPQRKVSYRHLLLRH